MQQAFRLAIEMTKRVPPHDFGRRLKRADRLIGVAGKMDRGMNRVLRHNPPIASGYESSIER
jgi:hypothetical protein